MSTAPLSNSSAMNLHGTGDVPAALLPRAFKAQIAKIREELREWNGESESRLEDVSDEAWLKSLEIARDMFACNPKLELMVDPSEPTFPYVVIEVVRDPSLDLMAWLSKETSWHNRVHSLYPGSFTFPRLIAYSSPK
jgi:hypothetical protein